MTNGEYKYLGRRYGSYYRQFFINETRLRAGVIYGYIVGPDPMSPEEVARDFNVPLEAVLECVEYCEKNPDVLRQDWEEEEALIARRRAENPAAYPLPPKS
jgi:uncharacterized protein (DUF433 family)